MHHKIYLILAHNKPAQLHLLIKKLSDERSIFIIHIDKSANIDNFKLKNNPKNVYFLNNRFSCIWGDISIVQATLALIEFALGLRKEGHLILLSGTCMPLATNNELTDFFVSNKNVNFIDIHRVESFWDSEEIYKRFFYYNLHFKPRITISIMPIVSLGSLFGQFIRLIKLLLFLLKEKKYEYILELRRFTKNRTFFFTKNFGGSQWWALTYPTAKAILELIQKNPAIMKGYQYSHVPDETLFQTALMHLPEILKTHLIRNSVTYANWMRVNVSLPVTYNSDDFNELVQKRKENYLFARKFDLDLDDFFISQLPIITKPVNQQLVPES